MSASSEKLLLRMFILLVIVLSLAVTLRAARELYELGLLRGEAETTLSSLRSERAYLQYDIDLARERLALYEKSRSDASDRSPVTEKCGIENIVGN